MARRGDVLVVLRKLGFGAAGRRERFVMLQADILTGLETAIVAPLDEHAPIYDEDPLVIQVSPAESGTAKRHVVLVHLLTAARLERFEPGVVGRLSSKSMAAVDALLRIALQL